MKYIFYNLQTGLSLKFAGFNVETVEYKNISFTVWDVGGQDKVLKCAHNWAISQMDYHSLNS